MSNDEQSRERRTAAPLALTRRGILKLIGAGIAIATLPDLAACTIETAPGPDDDQLLASAKWIVVGRRDDLVVLTLGIIGLDVMDAGKKAPPDGLTLHGSLYLGRTGGPAYILVDHPPQHIFEEAFQEPGIGPPAPGTVPAGGAVQHRIARKSRLSFFVPDAVLAIPYELDAILAAISTLQLHVAPNAWDEPVGANVIYAPSFEPTPIASANVATTTALAPTSTRIKQALKAARARKNRLAFRAVNPESTLRTVADKGIRVADNVLRVGPILPQAPDGLQTQIEMPFRLVISPNSHAVWQHASSPVVSSTGRVELWHSRMTTPEGWQKTIRALWTRDPGFSPNDTKAQSLAPAPFDGPMSPKNRADIVQVTTNFTLFDNTGATRARAVDVDSLTLSSLGAWLDSHGAWAEPKPGTGPSIAAWDHRATMGRDQKVRIESYGFLYPFGHEAIWVTVSERKFVPGYDDTAYLWTHQYLIIKEPLKTYDALDPVIVRGFPFTSVRFKTLVTPNIDAPSGLPGMSNSSWVEVSGNAFSFEVEAFDHDGNAHTFTTACMWLAGDDLPSFNADAIATAWKGTSFPDGERRRTPMKSQRVALAPSDDLDDTTYSAKSMSHTAKQAPLGNSVPFVPQLDVAEIAVDTVRAMTGVDASTTFKYVGDYLQKGFDAANAVTPNNVTGAFMQLAGDASTAAELALSKQSDKSGGFASPDLAITALSRAQGLLSGDPAMLIGSAAMFNPAMFFDAVGAKLFGVLKLSDLIDALGGKDILAQAPKFLTQALDAAELVFHTLQNASSIGDDLKKRILAEIDKVIGAIPPNVSPLTQNLPPKFALLPVEQQLYNRVLAKAAALGLSPMQLQAESTKLGMVLDAVLMAAEALAGDLEKVAKIDEKTDLSALADSIVSDVTKARDALSALGDTLKSLVLPIDEGVKTQLLSIYDKVVVQLLPTPMALDVFKAAVVGFVNAQEAIKDQHVKLDWSPQISGWPVGNEIFWPNDKNGFKVGVEIRAKAGGGEPAGASVFASLTDFELRLIGNDDCIKLVFDKLVFKAGTDGKATVDCGFRGVHFDGPLSFIETIRQFIPLDGFSDPPAIQVSTAGIAASFSLPLPNVAIGVFSLENLSISAGFTIPFIGKSLTVDFAFCTRESPFVLTVCMLGGGGFVGLTIAPDGVRLLEIALEAQACLAVDFGVASGSISVALGIYFAIEAGNAKLTGYFRLRGEVEVLGIISACIELKLELSYESSTGKCVGRASLEIEVSVLCFSTSVTIETEKKFSGNNSDPTFRQVMAYDASTSYAPWDDYCGAFTLVAA